MHRRKNGRSSFGVLDDVRGTLSLLDIPFTDINNIVMSPNSILTGFV